MGSKDKVNIDPIKKIIYNFEQSNHRFYIAENIDIVSEVRSDDCIQIDYIVTRSTKVPIFKEDLKFNVKTWSKKSHIVLDYNKYIRLRRNWLINTIESSK